MYCELHANHVSRVNNRRRSRRCGGGGVAIDAVCNVHDATQICMEGCQRWVVQTPIHEVVLLGMLVPLQGIGIGIKMHWT
jgi:hypothetical protein